MKKSRKVLCSIIAVFLLFAVAVSAFAATGAEQKSSALSITVETDKDSYKSFGAANITVTVTNTSNEDIQNVSAEAVFDDLTPVGRNSKTTAEAATLKAGESLSFSYKAMLNQENFKLNIFEKILAFFVKLFNMGYKAETHDFNDGRSFIRQNDILTFGKNEAQNVVKVWCNSLQENKPTEPTYNEPTQEEIDKELEAIASINDGKLPRIIYSDYGNVDEIDGYYYDGIITNENEAIQSLKSVSNLFGIEDVEKEFKCRWNSTDFSGTTYILQQYYNGYEVKGAELTISIFNSQNRADSVHGTYIPQGFINTSINISKDDAISRIGVDNKYINKNIDLVFHRKTNSLKYELWYTAFPREFLHWTKYSAVTIILIPSPAATVKACFT